MQSEFNEHRRRRWMRPNAHLYIRHDVHRLMPPGSPIYVGEDVVKYFWPETNAGREEQKFVDEWEAERAELLRMKQELAAIRADLRLERLYQAAKAYNPHQPRVAAGNPMAANGRAREAVGWAARGWRPRTSHGLDRKRWPLSR